MMSWLLHSSMSSLKASPIYYDQPFELFSTHPYLGINTLLLLFFWGMVNTLLLTNVICRLPLLHSKSLLFFPFPISFFYTGYTGALRSNMSLSPSFFFSVWPEFLISNLVWSKSWHYFYETPSRVRRVKELAIKYFFIKRSCRNFWYFLHQFILVSFIYPSFSVQWIITYKSWFNRLHH